MNVHNVRETVGNAIMKGVYFTQVMIAIFGCMIGLSLYGAWVITSDVALHCAGYTFSNGEIVPRY